jgi:hypothetical protein
MASINFKREHGTLSVYKNKQMEMDEFLSAEKES